jgi:hypothetical protein
LKKSETKDQNEKSTQIEGMSLNVMRFGAGFHLNKTTRFRKNSVVSSTVHKKKSLKRCRFKWHCGSSSSPGRASQGKKKIFFSPGFFSLFLRKHQKDVDHNPTCINSDLWPTTGR